MLRARSLLALSLALVPSGCGGGSSPAAPTGPVSTVALLVRDGWDERPVAGAAVSIGGGSVVSGSDGRLSVSAATGTALRVDAPGFLRRETAYRGTPELDLWSTAVTNLDYIFALGYNLSPQVKLSHPDFGTVQVVISDDIRNDAAASTTVQAAIAEINRATGGKITLSLDATTPVSLRLAVDAAKANQALGLTYNQYRGNLIVGADIYFATMQEARSITVLHELGHGIGLGHSIDPNDVMFPSLAFRTVPIFSDGERRVIAMTVKRPPGNAFPDNDLGVAAASALQPLVTVAIVCPGR